MESLLDAYYFQADTSAHHGKRTTRHQLHALIMSLEHLYSPFATATAYQEKLLFQAPETKAKKRPDQHRDDSSPDSC